MTGRRGGLWVAGHDLYAADSTELRRISQQLGATKQLYGARTPSERLADLTPAQLEAASRLGAQRVTEGQVALLIEGRRVGVVVDVDLLRSSPAIITAQLAAAAGREASWQKPHRVQLSRRAGFLLPPRTVSVAAPTRWANPFRPATRSPEANAAAVDHFRDYLERNPQLVELAHTELAGLNLACWCALRLACHADVWLETVNSGA